MPLYEYRCPDCGHEFEMMLRFSEASKTPACPRCESIRTHKKLSTVASFGSSDNSFGNSSSSCGSSGGFS